MSVTQTIARCSLLSQLLVSVACSSALKSEASSTVPEQNERATAVDALKLKGNFSTLTNILGTWSGSVRYYLPKGLQPPPTGTYRVHISPAFGGAGLMICTGELKACSDMSIAFQDSNNSELRIAFYRSSSQPYTDGSVVDVVNDPLSLKKDGLTWTSREVSQQVVKNDVIVKDAANKHRRYSYTLKKSGELTYLLENSDDGKLWVKFYEATLTRVE